MEEGGEGAEGGLTKEESKERQIMALLLKIKSEYHHSNIHIHYLQVSPLQQRHQQRSSTWRTIRSPQPHNLSNMSGQDICFNMVILHVQIVYLALEMCMASSEGVEGSYVRRKDYYVDYANGMLVVLASLFPICLLLELPSYTIPLPLPIKLF